MADGSEEAVYEVDEDRTLANLRGEDVEGRMLDRNDPNAVLHWRWVHDQEYPDDPYQDDLQFACPHCGSEGHDEFGREERTRVEDRLATVDLKGDPKPGMIVERHLIDGDVVIFNRQPSLHRMSMMVHEVRVMEGKTFRFNLAVCTPYNADFDGDEMNLHVIQGEEARAEAKILMRVQEHILSPRYGGNVIGGIHDHITGAYLLSKANPLVPHDTALQLLSAIEYTGELPVETEEGGVKGYRGLDLLNLIMPPESQDSRVRLDYQSRSGDAVKVREGAVLSGTIDKRGIGAEDGRILDAVLQNCGSSTGAVFLDKLTRLTISVCTSLGFTTGIDDEDLPLAALDEIQNANKEARAEVNSLLDKFGDKGANYEARAGRTVSETLEEDIMAILDRTKSVTGEVAKRYLGEDNSAVIMATSGARGSMDNLSMMAGSIGQAKVRGQRLARGYQDRVLSHFDRGRKGAAEKGFISSSFKRGLEPTEFFMLSVSGRESLVDTAVRTSKSGYMQRRLINALDDLKVQDDGHSSVRNTANKIIQFEYGEDGIDPTRSVHGDPIDIDAVVAQALGGDS